MDDEEAKRIQEERDKQLTEEYKDVTNPKKPDYDKIINEVGFQPDWDEIDPPMKGQGLVNEALMWGASAGIAAAAKPILKTIGPAGAIDAGINILTGESDTAFEKKLEIYRPAKVAAKGLRIFKGWLDDIFDKRVDKDYYTTGPLDTLKTAATGGLDVGTARDVGSYSYRKGRGLSNPIWDNLSSKVQKQFSDAGIDSDNATFFIENWNREVGATVEGLPFTDRTFDFMKGQLLPQILEDLKGVDLSDGLQLDHIAQLRAMTPFYKGRNLKQAEKIRRILIKQGIFGGHNPKNLKYLPTDVHTVKTRFWEQQVGKDGSKFFKGRKLKTYADIENAAKEMKAFIDRSNDIVEKVSSQYYLMRKTKISPEDLDRILQKVDLNYGSYNLKEVETLISEISIDTKTLGGYTGQNTIFSQIVADNISDLVRFTENNIRGEEALLDVIFKKMSPAAALKKYKKHDPNITQVTFDKYLKQARQKDVIEQLRNLRRGKSMKLDEQTGMRPDD
jgi:hypothetical protein